jgi:diadenosine tetraphosphate (Ap4A) HIT family hydrolase
VTNLTLIDCELCNSAGGHLLWQDEFSRAVLVDDNDYPGFCRVILKRHVKEMTELTNADRIRLMNVVFAVETTVGELARPDKINLASFGNAVPHLHWHVIPRWRSDRHFPKPVWANAERAAISRAAPDAHAYSRRLLQLLEP